MSDQPCPCCTRIIPTGSRAWLALCEACAFYFHRLQACPHEDEQ